MKTIVTFAAFIFIFLLIAPAQEETLIKNNNKRTQRDQPQEAVYKPLEDPVPIHDLYDGGGGYSPYFYYGDPSGMYFSEAWEDGSAGLIDGTLMAGSFRYNIYLQKMEAVVEGDTFAFAESCELEWVQIGDRKFIYSSFVRSTYEVSNTWFEVLCEGDCVLLLRRYIKYRVTDGDDDHSNDQLYKLEEYYTRKDKAGAERLYISKKSVLAAMQEHKTEVCDFIKQEKLKLKDQKDLVLLFAYYNTLE
jgi:hypothetical protein